MAHTEGSGALHQSGGAEEDRSQGNAAPHASSKAKRKWLTFTAFQRLFAERGLPDAIRTDNGLPFASPNGLYNLSRLSVWWLRLGIAIERYPSPANPPRTDATSACTSP
jgi:hypothetical protein